MTLLWLFWPILISYCKFLMPRPSKWCIRGANSIILSKNNHFIKSQRQIMCGSNFYESDVTCTHNLFSFGIDCALGRSFRKISSQIRSCPNLIFSRKLPAFTSCSVIELIGGQISMENVKSNANLSKLVQTFPDLFRLAKTC